MDGNNMFENRNNSENHSGQDVQPDNQVSDNSVNSVNVYQDNGSQLGGAYPNGGYQPNNVYQNNGYQQGNTYQNNNYQPNSGYQPNGAYRNSSYGQYQQYQPYGGQQPYNDSGLELEEPVKISEWVLTFVIMAVPCVNLIMMFVWAFSSSEKKSKSNFFKAYLIFFGIMMVLMMLFSFAMVFMASAL